MGVRLGVDEGSLKGSAPRSAQACAKPGAAHMGAFMSHPRTTVQYQIARLGQLPPGRVVDVTDRPGGHARILLHSLHASHRLADQLTHLHRHLIGHGLWQQRWTDDARMSRPPQGLCIAVARWEIVPARAMPSGHSCMPVEEDGSCIWLIREGHCTRALRDQMNQTLERVAGDGLWFQRWRPRQQRPTGATLGPQLTPSTAPSCR